MIFFDITKSAAARHRSGLTRVNARLLAELGPSAAPVEWNQGGWAPAKADTWLTAELFSEAERPGISAFLRKASCRREAIFHDAIPLRHPHITWPRSVARHPGYMKLLAEFDRVWAVSAASRDDLLGFWRWQGVAAPPPVEVLALGADYNGEKRVTAAGQAGLSQSNEVRTDLFRRSEAKKDDPTGVARGAAHHAGGVASQAIRLRFASPGQDGLARNRSLLCVGILEPRKNQSFLLDVCEDLWTDGLKFDLHVVGRINPHFGRPIARRIEKLRRKWPGLRHHAAADDARLTRLYAAARASVFPTVAEGCGLPLLESLWMGVPCVCSDLPVLRENTAGGGCLPVPVNDRSAWQAALRRVLADDGEHARLRAEATTRPLPRWAETAKRLRDSL